MPKKKPNVIVFFTDQQRWDSTGVHGNPLDLTPNFDRMAMEGTHLFNASTCQPVCGPARASLQTGLYASTTGCHTNGIPLSPEQKTLGHYFRDGGYHTGYIGKWHLASSREAPVPQNERSGYDYWLGSNVLEFTSNAYQTILQDNDGNEVNLPGYRVDALTDSAIRYIDRQKDEPFFLFLSYIEPHFQNHTDDFPAPIGYRERYAGKWTPPDLQALGGSTHQHIDGYWGMIKRLDEALGRIMDALISLRLYDDTIICFTTDHGCHFKTRNGEYKRSCHESSVRIPTAFRGGKFTGGGRLMQQTSLVDIPPSLLDAAGLPVPKDMQGHSVMPLTRGETCNWPEESFIQISEAGVSRAIRTNRWKYSVRAAKEDHLPQQAGATRYTEDFLYDLHNDPHELRNLVNKSSHAEACSILRERLIKRMVEAGEEAPEIVPAERKPSGQRGCRREEITDTTSYSGYTALPTF